LCAEHIRQYDNIRLLNLNCIYEGSTRKCAPLFDPFCVLIQSHMVVTGPLYISTRIPERNITRELYKFRTCLLLALYLVAVPTNETRPFIQLCLEADRVLMWGQFN